jgi:hypothetical protein
MDNPERQVAAVIQALCTRSIPDQQAVIRDYFTPDAYFIHPFCRVPSFSVRALPLDDRELNSRAIIQFIYHWYRILSPQIDVRVESAVFDKRNQLLYATIFQTFTLWFIPFSLWQSKVKLVTVLELARLPVDSKGRPLPGTSHPDDWTQPTRYFIRGQEDHYQVNEFLKFVFPWGASLIWYVWQVLATVVCIIGALVFWPVTSFYDYFTHEVSPGGPSSPPRMSPPRKL